MPRDPNGLNDWEKDTLISFFQNIMNQEQRRRLMRELPVIYNKICGRTIVEVRIRGRHDHLDKVIEPEGGDE